MPFPDGNEALSCIKISRGVGGGGEEEAYANNINDNDYLDTRVEQLSWYSVVVLCYTY